MRIGSSGFTIERGSRRINACLKYCALAIQDIITYRFFSNFTIVKVHSYKRVLL